MKIKKLLELIKFNKWVIRKINKSIKMGLPVKYAKGIKLAYAIFKFALAIKFDYSLAIWIAVLTIFLRGSSLKLDKNINPILEEGIVKFLLRVSTTIFFLKVFKMMVYIMF